MVIRTHPSFLSAFLGPLLSREDLMTTVHARVPMPGVDPKQVAEYWQTVRKAAGMVQKLQAIPKWLPIVHPLREADLPEEVMPRLRPWIPRTYNHLVHSHELRILREKERRFNDCPELAPVVQEFTPHIKSLGFDFDAVLDLVKPLKDRDLADLHRHVLGKELSRLNRLKLHNEGLIYDTYALTYHRAFLSVRSSELFHRGDFDFIGDQVSRRILKNAFDVLEAAKGWTLLNFDAEEDRFKFLTQCGPLKDLMKQMDDKNGYSGTSMSFVMRNMHMINRMGWSAYVSLKCKEQLEGG